MYRKNIVWRIVTNINCNKCNFCIVGSPAISTKTAIFFLNFFFSFQRINNIFREIKYDLSYKVSPWAYNIRFWGYLSLKVVYAFNMKYTSEMTFWGFVEDHDAVVWCIKIFLLQIKGPTRCTVNGPCFFHINYGNNWIGRKHYI